MRILFVSALAEAYASGRQRLDSLDSLGHEVTGFALDAFDARSRLEVLVRTRLPVRRYRSSDERRLCEALLGAIRASRPELVWMEKALLATRSTLEQLRSAAPQASFACFQDDDPFGARLHELAHWSNFIDAIPAYDIHFVKRAANVPEFLARGARRVELIMHGVYPRLFRAPPSGQPGFLHDVVFVGSPLDHRVHDIGELIGKHEIPLSVYGNSWERTPPFRRFRERFHPGVAAEAYAAVLGRSRIALGFVSSSNRDEYTMRSFEIPACGAMLLAERTPTHAALFREGEEAEFFASAEECADKCRFYLANEAARARVAARGLAWSLRPEVSLRARMAEALAHARSSV